MRTLLMLEKDFAAPQQDDNNQEKRPQSASSTAFSPPHQRYYGTNNLWFILALSFLCAVTAIMVRTRLQYNTSLYQDWIWAGALTSQSIALRVRLNPHWGQRLVVSTLPLTTYQSKEQDSILLELPLESWYTQPQRMQTVVVSDLQPSQTYYYTRWSQSNQLLYQGQVQTAPVEHRRTNFSILAAGNAWTGSQHVIFQEMAQSVSRDDRDDPVLLWLHLGNLHTTDVQASTVEERFQAFDRVMGSPGQARVLQKMGLAYMWHDRDYLGPNTLSLQGQSAALESYQQAVPSSSSTGTTYQAFTIGTVRFVLSDLSSEMTEHHMMSPEQWDWLQSELSQAPQYDFLIWVTPSTWMGPPQERHDWVGRPEDRQQLSEFISSIPSRNILAVSAGSNLWAFDDGSNTYYRSTTSATNETSSTPVYSFPLLQSGPLDRMGEAAARIPHYSDGCASVRYERNHVYSTMHFLFPKNDREEACVEIRSFQIKQWRRGQEEIFRKKLCGQIFAPHDESIASLLWKEHATCETANFTWPLVCLLYACGIMLFLNVVLCLGVGPTRADGLTLVLYVMVGVLTNGTAMLYLPQWTRHLVDQFDSHLMATIILAQLLVTAIYLLGWIRSLQSQQDGWWWWLGRQRQDALVNDDCALEGEGSDSDNYGVETKASHKRVDDEEETHCFSQNDFSVLREDPPAAVAKV